MIIELNTSEEITVLQIALSVVKQHIFRNPTGSGNDAQLCNAADSINEKVQAELRASVTFKSAVTSDDGRLSVTIEGYNVEVRIGDKVSNRSKSELPKRSPLRRYIEGWMTIDELNCEICIFDDPLTRDDMGVVVEMIQTNNPDLERHAGSYNDTFCPAHK